MKNLNKTMWILEEIVSEPYERNYSFILAVSHSEKELKEFAKRKYPKALSDDKIWKEINDNQFLTLTEDEEEYRSTELCISTVNLV